MTSLLFLGLFLFIACGEPSNDDMASKTEAVTTTKSGSGSGLSWQVPNDWTAEQPTSSMRIAQFSLPRSGSDAEDASLVIFYFGGEGGGTDANIQRWISQFSEADVAASEPKRTEVNGLAQTHVDITGTYLFKTRPMAPTATEKPGFRMLAAVIEGAGGPWFVKFVGPKDTVAKWEAAFQGFLASCKLAG